MIVNVVTDDRLECTDHKKTETEIRRKAEKVSCRLRTPGFRTIDCGLFGMLLGEDLLRVFYQGARKRFLKKTELEVRIKQEERPFKSVATISRQGT